MQGSRISPRGAIGADARPAARSTPRIPRRWSARARIGVIALITVAFALGVLAGLRASDGPASSVDAASGASAESITTETTDTLTAVSASRVAVDGDPPFATPDSVRSSTPLTRGAAAGSDRLSPPARLPVTTALFPQASGEAPPSAESPDSFPLAAADRNEVPQAIVHVQTADDGGTGFIISDRHILTSDHVVRDAQNVVLHFFNGTRGEARVAGIDAVAGVALLEVEALPPNVRRLKWESVPTPSRTTAVFVWGYPFESRVIGAGFALSLSVSGGIISAVRTRGGVAYLQTDAAVNPGNSGGPLTTVDGEVVGLLQFILVPDGRDAEGLNFAVDLTREPERIRALLFAAANPAASSVGAE